MNILCATCRHWQPVETKIAGWRETVYHCTQSVPRAGTLTECSVYEREPGSDDELHDLVEQP